MSVQRIHEDPRVTKPYTDEQWTQIESLGHEVDRLLEVNNVRLTMGGEPTFVSIDDMEGAEWNIDRDGTRTSAGWPATLFCRLADRFATGPLLHYGQGKWYPGEPLPRWALGCYWRGDGEPIWRDPQLIAKDDVSVWLRRQCTLSSSLPSAGRAARMSAPKTRSRPTKMPGTTCGKSAGCR